MKPNQYNNGAPLNLLGLVRVSTILQEDGAGIERQHLDLDKIERQNNVKVIERIDVTESGSQMRDNEELKQILTRIEHDPSIHGIGVSSTDRIVRPVSFHDFGVFEPFRVFKKLIFTKWSVIDCSTISGWQQVVEEAKYAGIERQRIRERCMDGKEALRRIYHEHPGSRITLPRGICFERGKRKGEGRWYYDEPIIAKIHKAYEMLFEGIHYCEIAAFLGMKSQTGAKKLLLNVAYTGLMRYDEERVGPVLITKTGRKYRARGKREVEDIIEFMLPLDPVIDAERWLEARRIINTKTAAFREYLRRKPTRRENLLPGHKLRCPCKRCYYLRPDKRKGQHDLFYCASRHPANKKRGVLPCSSPSIRVDAFEARLEDLFDPAFRQGITADVLVSAFGAVATANGMAPERAAHIESELKRIKAGQDDLADELGERRMSKEAYRAAWTRLEEKAKALRAKQPTAGTKMDFGRLVKDLAEVLGGYRYMKREKKRDFLKLAVKEFYLVDGSLESIQFSGGFVGGIYAKSKTHLSTNSQFSVFPDLTVKLPVPLRLQ